MVPTRRLAVVLVAAAVVVVGLPDGVSRLLVVNGIVLVAALLDFVLAPSPRSIEIERDLPAVVSLGNAATIEWWVRNPGGRAVTVSIADELAPSLRAEVRRFRVRVPRGGRARSTTQFRPARRGRFTIERITVRTEGPLGLLAKQRTRRQPTSLRVYPAFGSREEAELRIDKARILEVGLRSAKGRGGGTEFDQLREYTPDDDFRRIDWSATARVNRPIVRTFRAERNQPVVILLDNGRVMAARVDGVPRVEHAMDAALLIATVATRLGDRCGLVAFDRDVRAVVPLGGGRRQVGLITEAMFDLEPVLIESDYGGAFSVALTRFRRRALFVLLTDLVEQAVGESLLPALPLLTRQHVLLVGAVQNPEVVAWADEEADGATEAYRRAAAIRGLDERAATVARLRGLGATVVDAPAGVMSAKLGDAYLHLKATGRI